MLWTFDRFCSRRRGRSQGGVGILQIVGIRAGDLRDSTVLFGAHPCPTIATAVQPGMFRSTKINQLQSRSRNGTRGLLGVFAFAMRRSRVRSPSAPVHTRPWPLTGFQARRRLSSNFPTALTGPKAFDRLAGSPILACMKDTQHDYIAFRQLIANLVVRGEHAPNFSGNEARQALP